MAIDQLLAVSTLSAPAPQALGSIGGQTGGAPGGQAGGAPVPRSPDVLGATGDAAPEPIALDQLGSPAQEKRSTKS